MAGGCRGDEVGKAVGISCGGEVSTCSGLSVGERGTGGCKGDCVRDSVGLLVGNVEGVGMCTCPGSFEEGADGSKVGWKLVGSSERLP